MLPGSSPLPTTTDAEFSSNIISDKEKVDDPGFKKIWIDRMQKKQRQIHKKFIDKRIEEIEAEIRLEIKDKDISDKRFLLSCCKKFDDPEKLFEHLKKHHNKDALKCVLCEKKLSSKSSLDRHLLIHAGWQPYECSLCGKVFSTNGNMHRHKKTHKGVFKGNKVSSKDTGKCSKTENQKMKEETFEKGSNDWKRKRKIDDIPNKAIKKIKSTNSDDASTPIKNGMHSKADEADQHPSSTPRSIHGEETTNASNKKQFITTLGLKENEMTLEEHSEKFEENNIWPQEDFKICTLQKVMECLLTKRDVDTNSPCSLIIEKSDVYGNEPHDTADKSPSKCEINDNSNSASENALPANLKEDIMQENFFTCEYCNKKFKNRNVLRKHKMKHNKQKPFKCSLCERRFINKPNAIRHVIDIHKESRGSAKDFIAYNLSDKGDSETKSVCEWCRKDFISNIILEHHKRSASGCTAKPFRCTVCNRNFSTKNNGHRHFLKRHEREPNENDIVPNDLSKTQCLSTNDDTESDVNQDYYAISDNENTQMATCPTENDSNQISSLETSSENEESMNNLTCESDTSEECTENSDPLPEMLDSDIVSISPSKRMDELEAAHSLIDMSSQYSKLLPEPLYQIGSDKSNDIINTQLGLQSGETNASPLDLTIRPIDLTAKFQSQSSNVSILSTTSIFLDACKKILLAEHFSPTIMNVEQEGASFSDAPLNLSMKSAQNVKEENSTFREISSSPLVFSSFYSENRDVSLGEDLLINESPCDVSTSGIKPVFYCDICNKTFANPSNKRRHLKNQHQDLVQTPANPSPSSVTKESPSSQQKSLLSKKTKEALITKVSSKPNYATLDNAVQNSSEVIHGLENITESESGDLASVSSLINTANSPQLKKFLTEDSNADALPSREESTLDSNDDVNNLPKNSDQTSRSSKSPRKYQCSECQKPFKCNSSFKRHFVTHTKEKNYYCPICKQGFSVKSNRDRHVKNQHNTPACKTNMLSRKKLQRKLSSVPTESSAMDIDRKAPTLPLEPVHNELMQCNKENERLYIHS